MKNEIITVYLDTALLEQCKPILEKLGITIEEYCTLCVEETARQGKIPFECEKQMQKKEN